MSKKIIIIGVIVIAVAAAAAWMMRQNNTSAPSSDQQQQGAPEVSAPQPLTSGETQMPAANQPVPQANAVKEFTVTGQNYSFTPAALTVKKGDTVKIVFKNAGGFHDFKIDEFNAATKRINGGQQDTITFIADKAGSFEFYCSVGSHRQMGMKGALTVEQ